MAESAVTFLLQKLGPLLEQGLNFVNGYEEEIAFIKDELERMMAFLGVGDAVEEGNPELKVWVKQVRDVAYDTEAFLDLCMLHRMQNEDDDRGNRVHVFLAKCTRPIKNLWINHKIAVKIRSIKARISDVNNRFNNWPPHRLTNLAILNSTVNDRRGDAMLLEEADLVGIESRRKELNGLIMEGDSGLKVVSVLGMGGLGKTTLVKKVYDEAGFKKCFQSHAWITVSQSFRAEDLLKDMIQQLHDEIKCPLPPKWTTMSCYELKDSIKQFLRQRKFVLVLDDVWRIQAWDDIKYVLPNDNGGSCVILTTRIVDVARYVSVQNVYELKPLSPTESWRLFCQQTFRGDSSSCPPHLKEISLSILKRCAGLPLAIVAIAGVLATKSVTRIDDWEALNRSLTAEFQGNDRLESVQLVLSLSFNDLPCILKSCFQYLSLFPEDHVFERNKLLRIWVAQGLVNQTGGRTEEEVAEASLNELVNRNLIHVIKYNDDGSFKSGCLHDFLREMLLQKSRDGNFAVTFSDQDSTPLNNKVRHLSVHGKLANLKPKRSAGSKLITLLAFGMKESRSMSDLLVLLGNCRQLKVLDLTGAPINTIPKAAFKLFLLRHLNLRGTEVKLIPRSIENLQMLETLDLKNTRVSELPLEILRLERLRHLLVYRHVEYSYLPFDCILGFKALQGIGRLTSLQKLSFIEATQGTDIFSQLEMMTELRRLSILKLRKEDGAHLCSCIQKLHKIRSLSLSSIAEGEVLDLDCLFSPPPFLQRLYLKGRLTKFPTWIQSLHCLVKIYFRWSRLEDDPLQYLQDLPSLVHLEFLVGYIGEELHFKAGKFPKLKLLGLDKVETVTLVTVEKGAAHNLEKLMIQRCVSLRSVPVGIEWLSNMKHLEFFDMPDEFIARIRRQGEDYRKISHIPEVYCTYWKNGCWEAYALGGEHEYEYFGSSDFVDRTHERRNSL